VGGHVVRMARNAGSVKSHNLHRLCACHSCFNSRRYGAWCPHLAEAVLTRIAWQRIGQRQQSATGAVRFISTRKQHDAAHLHVRGVEAHDTRVRHTQHGAGNRQLCTSAGSAAVCVACLCCEFAL
jgi:hypothetical protein